MIVDDLNLSEDHKCDSQDVCSVMAAKIPYQVLAEDHKNPTCLAASFKETGTVAQ